MGALPLNKRRDKGWHPRKDQVAIQQLACWAKAQLWDSLPLEPPLHINLQLGRPSCYLTIRRPNQALVVRLSNHPLPNKRTKIMSLVRQMPVDFLNLEHVLEEDPEKILGRIRAWIWDSCN
jgi:hypothetical protein